MTNMPIARIRLAPGQVGYYDEYSRIYLSISQPEADIFAGTNLLQIRRSLRSGRLQLVSGSLTSNVQQPKKTEKKETKVAETTKKVEIKARQEQPEPVIEVQEVIEPMAVEEVVVPVEAETAVIAEEAPIVEVAEEPKQKRNNRRKKKVEEAVVKEQATEVE